jgi:hypothetical protein
MQSDGVRITNFAWSTHPRSFPKGPYAHATRALSFVLGLRLKRLPLLLFEFLTNKEKLFKNKTLERLDTDYHDHRLNPNEINHKNKINSIKNFNRQHSKHSHNEPFYATQHNSDNTTGSLKSDLLNTSSSNTNSYLHMLSQQQPNASSYAAIAHAAAAAAASNCYNANQATRKIISYNNPGFFESNQFGNVLKLFSC